MADIRIPVPQRTGGDVTEPAASLRFTPMDLKGKCLAVSPEGLQLNIPKELFTALTDFMQTRKCPGSIMIQFRGGDIVCVEAIAKKTYRNS